MSLMQSPPAAKTLIDGTEFDYFCGTGYFALHGHPDLIDAACHATQQYGLGPATRTFDHPVLLAVETQAARFFDTEAAHYYVSGYLGNTLLLKGLAPDYDVILIDSESHYSVFDGAAASGKPTVRFAHADPDALRDTLRATLKPGQRPLVITDGIFPTSGRIAPLPAYHQILKDYDQALLCVDDAHATGVLGEKGQGTLEYLGLQGEGCYSSGTLSKALGGFGGIIAGSESFIKKVALKGASPVPLAAAAASATALSLLMQQPHLRQTLWDNARYAKAAFRSLGFTDIPDTPVPFFCLSGGGFDYKTIQEELHKQGRAVLYIPEGGYTEVPVGGAIRIAIFSTHTRAQIDCLVAAVSVLLR